LAKEIDADWLVLDDLAARRQAQKIGLRVIGTLGVLLMGKTAGHGSALKPLLDNLRESGFRMSAELYKQVLQDAEESP
jgi:predicted nucleic acid-binding protein